MHYVNILKVQQLDNQLRDLQDSVDMERIHKDIFIAEFGTDSEPARDATERFLRKV